MHIPVLRVCVCVCVGGGGGVWVCVCEGGREGRETWGKMYACMLGLGKFWCCYVYNANSYLHSMLLGELSCQAPVVRCFLEYKICR